MKIETVLQRAWHLLSVAFMILMVVLLIGPLTPQKSGAKSTPEKELLEFLAEHRIGSSPDYAFVKNGRDYLAVFIGYADDRQTCLEAAQQYNGDPSLSILPGTYQCVQLNQ